MELTMHETLCAKVCIIFSYIISAKMVTLDL